MSAARPAGWTIAPLGSVLPIEYGAGLPKARRAEGRVPVYGSNGVAGYHSESLTSGPAIIVGRKGSAGAVQLCMEPCWPIDTTYFAVGSESVDLRYFFHLLTHARLDQLDRSTAIPSLSRDDYNDVQVPVAPLPEQRRIVAKIEELFSDLDAGVAALERVRANLKRYRAAVLKAAVEGRLTGGESPPMPVPWRPIGEVIHDLEQGWSPKCESSPATEDGEWAVMTTTAIQPLAFSSNENKRLPKNLAPRADLEVRVGDMMITRAGPRSRAGVACLVRSTRRRLILCDKAYRFRCDDDKVRGAFLEIALNADPVLRHLEKMKTGISDSGVNLTQPRFRELLVPIPPLAFQDRTIAEVDRRLSVADAAEQQVVHALQRAARLRQSILKRAFEGKLVPQDPTDEPATTLFARANAPGNGHRAVIETSAEPRPTSTKRRSRARA